MRIKMPETDTDRLAQWMVYRHMSSIAELYDALAQAGSEVNYKYVCQCFNNKKFGSKLIYAIQNVLDIPHEEMGKIFFNVDMEAKDVQN